MNDDIDRASEPPERLRVLVIDDEPLIGRAVKRTLADHDVVYEERSDRAIARLRAGEPFDVVLCDLRMPGSDGLAVLATIATLAPQLARRSVLMTGGASEEALTTIAARGVRMLEKPFEPEALHRALREAARCT
ncbi:MAG: response regulator [Myxococcota bacterium]|nr:response regulator [Myxococcota bacterium]